MTGILIFFLLLTWFIMGTYEASSNQSTSNNIDMMECPMQNKINPANLMETNLMQLNSTPSKAPLMNELSRDRVSSSIPRADCPIDNHNTDRPNENHHGTWQYPSPQMFYAAMHRKGHPAIQNVNNTQDMNIIVNIHNMVNEQTWQSILRWENCLPTLANTTNDPKLKRFLGRPGDWTPKAWWRHYILGYVAPFDRHDWYVERSDGRIVRYVIDFYPGTSQARTNLPAFYIDARPALDSWSALRQRLLFTWCQWKNSFLNLKGNSDQSK